MLPAACLQSGNAVKKEDEGSDRPEFRLGVSRPSGAQLPRFDGPHQIGVNSGFK